MNDSVVCVNESTLYTHEHSASGADYDRLESGVVLMFGHLHTTCYARVGDIFKSALGCRKGGRCAAR